MFSEKPAGGNRCPHCLAILGAPHIASCPKATEFKNSEPVFTQEQGVDLKLAFDGLLLKGDTRLLEIENFNRPPIIKSDFEKEIDKILSEARMSRFEAAELIKIDKIVSSDSFQDFVKEKKGEEGLDDFNSDVARRYDRIYDSEGFAEYCDYVMPLYLAYLENLAFFGKNHVKSRLEKQIDEILSIARISRSQAAELIKINIIMADAGFYAFAKGVEKEGEEGMFHAYIFRLGEIYDEDGFENYRDFVMPLYKAYMKSLK